jgi:hypothetical protein
MEATERTKLIELYGRGVALLEECLASVPKEMWQYKPKPSEWSVHEIIVHLADSESYSAARARLLIAEPGGKIVGYDQDLWAITLDYHGQSWEDALEILRYARKTTHALIQNLPDSVWQHSVTHSEADSPYTFELWLKIYSGHIPVHIEQINSNKKLWEASK